MLMKIKYQECKALALCLAHDRGKCGVCFSPGPAVHQLRGLDKSHYLLGFIFFIGKIEEE